jgi:sarcinarray family protein
MKDDTMMRVCGIISFIGLLLIVFAIPIHSASECRYGSVHAWFRPSGGEWENATAHPLLKRGESFEIKIIVIIKTVLQVVYVKLHEFGSPVYEVITGPTIMEKPLEHWEPNLSNQSLTYIWKMRVRVNTSWVNGYGPLEVYVQFNKNDTDESWINFDVITAFIVDELWEKYSQGTVNKNFSSKQGFQPKPSSSSIIGMIIILFLVGVFLRVQQ